MYTLGYRDEDLVSLGSLNNPSKLQKCKNLNIGRQSLTSLVLRLRGSFQSSGWPRLYLACLMMNSFETEEMFYDKRFEAALETAGEAEQAEMTAGLNAGPDPTLETAYQEILANPAGWVMLEQSQN